MLDRRTGHAQPGGVDVAALECVVVEMGVVGRVGDERAHPAEVRIARPGDEPLVVERIGQRVGLQDARRGLRDAVADVLPLFADLGERVGPCLQALAFLLEVVFLALLARKSGIPGVEGGLGLGRGVGQVDGVDLVPEGGVEQGPERIARAEVGDRVHRDGHRIQRLVGGGGVPDGDLLERQGAAQLVAGHGIGHRVLNGSGAFRRPFGVALGEVEGLFRPPVEGERPGGDEGRHRERKCYARKQIHSQSTKLRTFGRFSKSAYIRS